MVERSLSMREVPGSIPGASKAKNFSHFASSLYYEIKPPRNNSPLQTHFHRMVVNLSPMKWRTQIKLTCKSYQLIHFIKI